MKYSLVVTRPQLRVFSAVCGNFTAGWLATILVTRNWLVLIVDVLLAMVSWYLAVKAEEILEIL